jgi:hypothetical protein
MKHRLMMMFNLSKDFMYQQDNRLGKHYLQDNKLLLDMVSMMKNLLDNKNLQCKLNKSLTLQSVDRFQQHTLSDLQNQLGSNIQLDIDLLWLK